MLTSILVRSLGLEPGSHPRAQPHISSASGLVIVGGWFYFVADDESHLIGLPGTDVESGALQLWPLEDARLPADHAQRKRLKRDLEALFHVPGDGRRAPMLVAWGSGSTPRRDVAYVIGLDAAGGRAGGARKIPLTRLHDVLRASTPDLNIEAGLVQGDALWLFSRANTGTPSNACFRVDLDD